MANASFAINGDVGSGRGALGLTDFASLTAVSTVLWTACPRKPHRYYITPTAVNNIVILPEIDTGDIDINKAKIGHTLYIYNTSGADVLNVNDSAGGAVSTLNAGDVYTFSAQTAPTTWISTNITGSSGGGSGILTTKGDTLGHDGVSEVRVPVGVDGRVYTADSTAPSGTAWKAPGAGTTGSIAYPLLMLQSTANRITYSDIAYFPWYDLRYNGYTNGVIVFNAEIGNRNLDIRLFDLTNGVSLGSLTGISASTITTFSVSNPAGDAKLALQVRKSQNGGDNPQIFGIILEFDQ